MAADYSPFSPQQLARYSDPDLLALLNTWQDERTFSEDGHPRRISVVGLSKVFAEVFRENIVGNDSRFNFWLTEGKKITRPIYVQEMLAVACQIIDQQHVTEWLSFCKWVLSHPDIRDPAAKNISCDKPDWHGARVFVQKLIEAIAKNPALCAESEQLEEVLFLLCTQASRDLDTGVINDSHSQFDRGMRFSRSRSLLTLMKFVQNNNYYLKTLLRVFEKRFAEHSFSAPEQAILGYMFPLLAAVDKKIAEKYRAKIFPPAEHNVWWVAFEGLIGYHNPSELIYTTVRNEYNYYIQHLHEFRKKTYHNYSLEDKLTDLFFYFYMQGKFTLHGEDSLLARYYQATDNDRHSWGKLFARVGRTSQHSTPSEEQKNKIVAFLQWRVAQKEACELSEFSAWLDVSWLDNRLFMQIAKEILQLVELTDIVIVNAWLGKFCALLPDLSAEVVECSWLLIKNLNKDIVCYLHIEHVQAILGAGEKSAAGHTRTITQKIAARLISAGGLNIDALHADRDC